MNEHTVPPRQWVATLYRPGLAAITITISGRNVPEAEANAARERGEGARVVARMEVNPR